MARNPQEYGLNPFDREYEVCRKFSESRVEEVNTLLRQITNPTDQIFGAVIFLARNDDLNELENLVKLANENPDSLLRAAVVKDERG